MHYRFQVNDWDKDDISLYKNNNECSSFIGLCVRCSTPGFLMRLNEISYACKLLRGGQQLFKCALLHACQWDKIKFVKFG